MSHSLTVLETQAFGSLAYVASPSATPTSSALSASPDSGFSPSPPFLSPQPSIRVLHPSPLQSVSEVRKSQVQQIRLELQRAAPRNVLNIFQKYGQQFSLDKKIVDRFETEYSLAFGLWDIGYKSRQQSLKDFDTL